ncbi:unnamed protein product, partial [Rotaria sp. Silwood2]
LIGGYLLSSLNNFDLRFCVNTGEDELCAFVLTIIKSKKYDKLIQSTWITQLHQKYPNVDQVKISKKQKKILILYFLILI